MSAKPNSNEVIVKLTNIAIPPRRGIPWSCLFLKWPKSSWWSPGQYLIPYFFHLLLHVNTGQATALTISIFELSGLAGFYFFFKKTGFSSLITACSLAFIAIQQAFIIPHIFYNGGEVLLFGFEGWFLYGCVAIKKPGIKLLVFVLLSGWIGFFCKSSFLWIYFSGLTCLWIQLSIHKNTLITYIKNGIWIAVPSITSLAAIFIFFLSKGENPSTVSTGFKLTWETFNFPLASPMLAGFSVDDMLRGLIFHPIGHTYNTTFIVIVLILLAALSLFLMLNIIRAVPQHNYRLFIIVFYAASILFFSWVFLRQLNISYESRHFRIIGLILTPGVIYLFGRFRIIYQVLFGLICVVIAVSSYGLFIKGYLFNKNISARGTSGIAQEYIDQPSLNYVMRLDRQNKHAIFAFTSAELGLEINHNRVITLDVPNPRLKFDYDDYTYDGHAGPLYIILPADYIGTKAAMIKKFFPDYGSFTEIRLSPKYVLYATK